MRNQKNGRPDGICRLIDQDGDIIIESYSEGKLHGLTVVITANAIVVALLHEGEVLSRFAFDKKFAEIKEGNHQRTGIALNHLTSDHLNPAVEDPQPSDHAEMDVVPAAVMANLQPKCEEEHNMV